MHVKDTNRFLMHTSVSWKQRSCLQHPVEKPEELLHISIFEKINFSLPPFSARDKLSYFMAVLVCSVKTLCNVQWSMHTVQVKLHARFCITD
uniref:Uncharacterized protein n=1 Tax=Rhipicephalus zambeziensis TaxID=60191 RepID=A0A224YGL7_9ACAR